MPDIKKQNEIEKTRIKQSVMIATLILIILWIVKISESHLQTNFMEWGIHPRHIDGLGGILWAPWIHSDFMHLYSNSIPLFVLFTGLFYHYRNSALWVLIFIYTFSGVAVWLFARDSWHIGASGIVYGLAAFIFFSGVFRKEAPAMALALIVVFLYGGLIWGILPSKPGVSWESHLAGFISGICASIMDRILNPPIKIQIKDDWEQSYAAGFNEDGNFDYFDEEDEFY